MWEPLPNPSPVYFYEENKPAAVQTLNFNFLDFDSKQPLLCPNTNVITNQKFIAMQILNQETVCDGFGEIAFRYPIDQLFDSSRSRLPSTDENSVDISDFLALLEPDEPSQHLQVNFPADTAPEVEIKVGEDLTEIELEEEDFGGNFESTSEDHFVNSTSTIFGFVDQPQQTINLEELLQERILEDPCQFHLSLKKNDTASPIIEKSLSGSKRQAKAPRPSKTALQESFDKNSPEYFKKRERNNESVRKSRDKARQKQQETGERVQDLTSENRRLQTRVDDLERELAILKSLFSNVAAGIKN